MTSIVQVDAFTSEAFGVNPAAVCVLLSRRSAVWKRVKVVGVGFFDREHTPVRIRVPSSCIEPIGS